MGTRPNDLEENEPGLLQTYMDVTGCSESDARNVLMYVCSEKKFEDESETMEDGFWSRGEEIRDWNFEGHKNGRAKLDRLVHELAPTVTMQPAHAS